MTEEHFGDRLRHVFAGIKNKEIAAKLGVVPSAVQNYLKGRVPDSELLLKISEMTGCDLHWLLTGEHARPVNFEAQKVNEGYINESFLEAKIREIVRQEIFAKMDVQDLGTIDEVLARSIEKDDNPGTALEAAFLWNGWDLDDVSVPQFSGWDGWSIEQKVNELKAFIDLDRRHLERQEIFRELKERK